jgi:choline dehydrogenase-like flavoprotein
MVKAAKHARKIMEQPQYKKVILNEHYPGPSVQSDAEWLVSVKNRVRTECESFISPDFIGFELKRVMPPVDHPLGTCAMMPKSQAGVVDPQLKVYGTQNLRIVDARYFVFSHNRVLILTNVCYKL